MNKLLLLLFSVSVAFGQNRASLDSLKHVVNNPISSDSIKTYGYIKLINYYKKNDEDSCRAYFKKLGDYAKNNNSSLAYYKYHFLRASYFGLFVKPGDDSYEFINGNLLEALRYSKEVNRPELISVTYGRLAQENARFGEKEKALAYGFEGEKIAIQYGLWEDLAFIYGQIGKIYNLNYQKTDKALQYLLKSDSVYTSIDFQGYKRGFTLSFIGDVYESLENLEEAKNYQNKALSVFKIAENEYQQSFIFGKLAIIERRQKNYAKALNYISKAISYYRENKNPLQEAVFLVLESEIYLDNGQTDKALEVGQKAIDLSKKNHHDIGILMALINQSKIFSKTNSFTRSSQLALEAESLALKLNSYAELKDIYELLYLNSEALGDYKQAYQYSKEYRSVNDTLVIQENIKNTKELEAKYQSEKKEKEIALLQSKNDLAEAQKKNQRNLYLAGMGITTIAGVFFFLLYRNRKKVNTKLRSLDAVKSNFFANISHEFRTPLTLISGPIEKKLENKKLNEEDRADFEMVQRNSKRLLNLVDQLLDLSKLESGNLQLQVSEGNLGLLLKSIASSFEHNAKTQALKYNINIQEPINGWFNRDAVEKIVTNLLSNAFKYVSEKGTINFTASTKGDTLEIAIENDGEIYGETKIEKIFDRFYQKDDSKDGVGIGLALVKELVLLHKGTIHVANTARKSVLFSVVLPIVKNQFLEEERVNKTVAPVPILITEDSENTRDNTSLTEEIHEDSPILLVVEDSEDIRLFIKNAFKNQYQIIEAHDGFEGIEKAIAFVPDIIISDIMMPKANGLELCKTLKNDERTSHIPIILLTAKTGEKTQYEGLEIGADDYITKPFKMKLLETRVNNLVSSRKQLRHRYSQEIILKPLDISISSIDQKFIEKTQAVLDAHLTDPDLSIEDFSKLVGMSRMQLHRKLKAITGLTASEFIRSQRLKLAASLILKSDVNISEICYQVGFNNPSYFSKCFREAFGCLPSEYSQK
ncbi:response regulator [Aequorivita todarodis]|uniref:response regulator n=1 Tax=Aequorivita todarodis TaxID=2036821 RepID=UPI002350581B|nr:response regulator [Aequorivita todarodis]MDC8001611.1 response regulator [Aequorivita todarodis]